jgi:Na+/proline symporter
VATLVCEDFYKPLFPRSSDRARVLLMKTTSYGVGAIGTGVAVVMARQEISSMFEIWNKIAVLLGGGFAGVYLLGVFTTRANSAGAISGAAVSIVVTIWMERQSDIHWVHYGAFAVSTCLVVGYVVSVLTGGSRRDLAGLTAFTTRDKPSIPVTAPAAERPSLAKAAAR